MELQDPTSEGGESDPRWQKSKADSPEPSCVSVKSSNSMIIPPGFSAEGPGTDLRLQKSRGVSPERSYVSMKSNASMIIPPGFSAGGIGTDLRVQQSRADSPERSYVSMKSNNSMVIPPGFSAGEPRTDPRLQKNRSDSPEPSCVSMKSDNSMIIPPGFSAGGLGADSRLHKNRADSPEPSCVSMKSDNSMIIPPGFSAGGPGTDPRLQKIRSDSPESGCVSMKSDNSMIIPPGFSAGGPGADPRLHKNRADSPEPSCVSMKSDNSMIIPPGFSAGGPGTDPRLHKNRTDSPEPSCVSMKSDNSMIIPPGFSAGGPGIDQRLQKNRADSPESGCVSMKSDNSMIIPPGFSAGGPRTDPRLHKSRVDSPEPSCVSMKSDNSMIIPPGFSAGGSGTDPSRGTDGRLQDQCRKTSVLRPVQHQQKVLAVQNLSMPAVEASHKVLVRHKNSMRIRYDSLIEGIRTPANKTLLKRIYTTLYIIEGESGGVNEEHEVLQTERETKRHLQHTSINCEDIFKRLKGPKVEMEESSTALKSRRKGEKGLKYQLRSVLTKGIAGIGKTVSVQKFILDWAEGEKNQDVDLMCVLPFRELNLVKDGQYSLHGLLSDFHPELKHLNPEIFNDLKAVLIFDGLDESRIPLNFAQCQRVSDITMTSSVGVLMTNLIKGELLPSAQIWITSRPAVASQIPSRYISRVTEIQGFDDPQKEEYFSKKISDEGQAKRIFSHIKAARSLHIMCYIPIFCWISATVLQRIIDQHRSEFPRTLTEMYSHFLLTQTTVKNEKYEEEDERDPTKLLESNRPMLLKLAELAFRQLIKGNVMFYEEDLRESGIDVSEAVVYSGFFTEIFREECVHQKKVYCFVHLSFQEFLAAVHVFHCYENQKMGALQCFIPSYREGCENVPLDDLLKGAVDKALENQNGNLDLFLRFLFGISLASNQSLLQGLLTNTHSSSEKTVEYIKTLIRGHEDQTYVSISSERSMSLFLCLSEMKDQSLPREIEEYLESKAHSEKGLTPGQCSAIACMLLMSEEVLDQLDLRKYEASETGYFRLIPALAVCKKAVLSGCSLNSYSCQSICSVLQSVNSSLKELDLSVNNVQESGAQLLSEGLKSSHCKLETLRLDSCNLDADACDHLGSALQSTNCSLKELDISNNDLQDSGVERLCAGLLSPHCKLEILRMSGCMVTHKGCSYLASALKSNPSYLRELDLRYNHPGESGVKLLSHLLKDPHYTLEKLQVEHGGEMRIQPGLKKYACKLTLDPNTAHPHLSLSEGNRKVENVGEDLQYPDHPDRFSEWEQVLTLECLSQRCYWEAECVGSGSEAFASVAVAYKTIHRKDRSDDSEFGANEQSWSLERSDEWHYARHNDKITDTPHPSQSCSPSPSSARSRSPSPCSARSRSPSPAPTSARSPSPAPTSARSRSPSPAPTSARSRSPLPSPSSARSRSPSPAHTSARSRSPSPAHTSARSRSPSPAPTSARSPSPAPTSACSPSPALTSARSRSPSPSGAHSRSPSPSPSNSHRIGVYLDWEAGNLFFYSVLNTKQRARLYTFHATFREPLYPGFWVNKGSSVCLCEIE